ncbi:MAG: dephospho-CoA kinase [Sideroxyarcus sp.]|nr:dephospho-CoA kinase [Sideroxyarcus sp.]
MKHYCHGLTGGIGSGKSTVAQLFADLGARIVDTDLISHQLTQAKGAAIPVIQQAFGTEFLAAEGALDRNKMRDLVFVDSDAKRRLEAILHPLILSQTKALAASTTEAPYTLVVVPLLFENGRYRDWLNRVIVVDCPEEQQITRTVQRSGLTEAAVRAIMKQQLDRARRLQLADEIICNDGSMDTLREQVRELHSRLIGL